MLNFRQIETFRAVMLSGSMTQAARELHTTQSNVSRVIAQLEKRVGLKLFERGQGKLSPSHEGALFLRDVELAFAGLRSLESSADTLRRRGNGRLRISTIPSAALLVVPKAIERFSKQFPDVCVSLHVADSLTVCQWTASGHSDVGVASDIYSSPGIEHVVADESIAVCLMPANHRLARQANPITPNDLDHEQFLSLSQNDLMRKRIDAVFEAAGGDKRSLIYESHFAAANFQMVAQGMGLTLSNPLYARGLLPDNVASREFLPEIRFLTYLIYPNGIAPNTLARKFSEHFSDVVKQTTG